MVPSYIQELIPPLVSEVSDYPLRNTRNITVPYNRTNISQKSCNPLDYGTLLQMIWKIHPHYQILINIALQTLTYHVFLPIILWEIDIALFCMHGLEIILVVLTIIFIETMFVITLYVNGVV